MKCYTVINDVANGIVKTRVKCHARSERSATQRVTEPSK